MAEFVEKRLLETVQEVEAMESLGLINEVERRKLIEKRREFEYRIARKTKNKSSYLSYVNYEKDVLKLLKLRRKKISCTQDKNVIEDAICLKSVKLLRFMTRRWAGNLDIWALRIEFAKSIGWLSEVSVAYRGCLSYFGTDPSLWIAWAQWEIEGWKDFDKAREILLILAPMYCPKSMPLYTEIFRMELLFIEQIQLKSNQKNIQGMEDIILENREKVMSCEVARVVYENAVIEIPTAEMYSQLYEVAKNFTFATDLKRQILRKLTKEFSKDEAMWKLISNICVDAPEDIPPCLFAEDEVKNDENNSGSDSEQDMKVEQTNTEKEISDLKINDEKEKDDSISITDILDKDIQDKKLNNDNVNKLSRILFVLDNAMRKIGKDFTSAYIDQLLQYMYCCWSSPELLLLLKNKVVLICEAFRQFLTLRDYVVWYTVAKDMKCDVNKIMDILDQAVDKFPEVVYFQYEKFKMSSQAAASDKDLIKLLNTTAKTLKGDYGVKAWCDVVDRVSDVKVKKKIFTQAAQQVEPNINKHMRVKNLQSLADRKLYKTFWRTYNKIKFVCPFEVLIHTTAIYNELQRKNPSVEQIRSAFETAIHQFGSTHYGLWVCYVYFEKLKGETTRSNVLRNRAHDQLEADQLQKFKDLIFDLDNCEDNEEEEAAATTTKTLPSLKDNYIRVFGFKELDIFTGLPTTTYSINKEKNIFFNSISEISNLNGCKKDLKMSSCEEDNLVWEKILHCLCKVKVYMPTPTYRKEKLKTVGQQNHNTFAQLRKNISKSYKLSGRLQCNDVSNTNLDNFLNEDVEDILQRSEILQPEFIKKKSLEPYFKGKRQEKLKNKKEREATTGSGWFDMKAPEMTEELQRDMDLLKMRSVLDPKQHYKNSSMKTTPKYFEVGRYVDTPEDFFANRNVKKGKKRTIAEELIHNEEVLQYQKKKCTEIIAKKHKQEQWHYRGKKKEKSSNKKNRNNASI